MLKPVEKEKIFNQKNFNNFVGTPLDCRIRVELTYIYIYIFAFKFTSRYLQPDIVPIKFATGIKNTS